MELEKYDIKIFSKSNTLCFGKHIFKYLDAEITATLNQDEHLSSGSSVLIKIDGGHKEYEQLMVIFRSSHLIQKINYLASPTGFYNNCIEITIISRTQEIRILDQSMTSCKDCDHKIECALNNV